MFTVMSNNQIVGWKNEKDAPAGPRFETKDAARSYRDAHKPAPKRVNLHKYNPIDDGEPDWAATNF